MSDYDNPKVPPATPLVIDPNVKPLEAHELAKRDGDSDYDGSAEAAEQGEAERMELNRKLARRDLDGAGEQELDATSPETTLPPD